MNFSKRIMLYGIDKRIVQRSETLEGILWDFQEASRVCRVKIQGSSKYVIAHYPQNWGRFPSWLKPGDAVRLLHSGGVRGRMEVVGHGEFIPTPISGTMFPPASIGADGVLTGCQVVALGVSPSATPSP